MLGLRPAGGLRRPALRPLAWVGTISFGLYLWHVPFMVVFRFRGDRPWLSDNSVLPLLAQALPAAILARRGALVPARAAGAQAGVASVTPGRSYRAGRRGPVTDVRRSLT